MAEGPLETCKRIEKMIVYNTDIKPTWLNSRKNYIDRGGGDGGGGGRGRGGGGDLC